MRLLSVACLLFALGGQSWAQQPTPTTLTDAQREQAKTTYTNGLRKYNLGKFEEAAQDFEKVYEITGDSSFLFNIAQSHRFAKNHERSIFFYKSYLRSNPPNRAEVEKRIVDETELLAKEKRERDAAEAQRLAEKRAAEKLAAEKLAAEKLAAQQQNQPPPDRQLVAPPPPPPPKPPSPAFKYAGIALVAVGVGMLAVGGAMTGLAVSASNDVQNAASSSMGAKMFTPSLHDKESNGKLYDTVSIAGYVVGGVAVATGAALLAIGLRKPSASRARLTPLLSPSQAGLALTGSF